MKRFNTHHQTSCLRTPRVSSLPSLLFELAAFIIAASALCVVVHTASAQAMSLDLEAEKRTSYLINAEVDFDELRYTGAARVRWTNTGERATGVLFFRLHANLRDAQSDSHEEYKHDEEASRAASESVNIKPASRDAASSDEPQLDILSVRLLTDGRDAGALPFALEERGSVLRVNLRQPALRRSTVEIEINFRGRVPEIDAEETGLLAHVVEGVDAALRDRREVRRAREFNFRSRGVMLLGAWYPVLAVREADGDWRRKAELSHGRIMFAEAADYLVKITLRAAPDNLPPADAFASGASFQNPNNAESSNPAASRTFNFRGKGLRDFPVVLSRNLRSADVEIEGVRIASVYPAEHERTGRRVLEVARDAIKIYTYRFGALPYKQVTLLGAPLVAGRGSLEFSGMSIIASAFYVDFDSPTVRNLPAIVREQRQSIEDSLEWTTAQGVAHQWWGAGAIGGDPERLPVLDEGLAQWSALLYYRARHDETRAAQALEDQLRGVYAVYRTFGGDDMVADRPASAYRNSFQYAAIVSSKGALLIESLCTQLGAERCARAVQNFYRIHELRIADADDLRDAFTRQAISPDERRAITRTFNRWLSERRGDEDIAPPNTQLANALGIPTPAASSANRTNAKPNELATATTNSSPTQTDTAQANANQAASQENANQANQANQASVNQANANQVRSNRFARFGRFFWKQMTRIR